jgi:Tfp pilus assembly protein PilF
LAEEMNIKLPTQLFLLISSISIGQLTIEIPLATAENNPFKLATKDQAQTLIKQGINKLERGQERAGMEDIEQAINIDPKYPAAHYYRGIIYAHRAGNYSICNRYQPNWASSKPLELPAGQDYQNCKEPVLTECTIENQANRQQVFCNSIYLFERIKYDRQQAIKSFDRAIELNPQYPQAYYHRGLTYLNLNKSNYLKNARTDLETALSIDSNFKDDLGGTSKNLPQASERIDRVLEISKIIDRDLSPQKSPSFPSGYSSLVPLERENVENLCTQASRLVKSGNIEAAIIKYQKVRSILLKNNHQQSQEFKEIDIIIAELIAGESRKGN